MTLGRPAPGAVVRKVAAFTLHLLAVIAVLAVVVVTADAVAGGLFVAAAAAVGGGGAARVRQSLGAIAGEGADVFCSVPRRSENPRIFDPATVPEKS